MKIQVYCYKEDFNEDELKTTLDTLGFTNISITYTNACKVLDLNLPKNPQNQS